MEMSDVDIRVLLSLVDKCINTDGSWISKRDRIKEIATDDELVCLNEFCGWFE